MVSWCMILLGDSFWERRDDERMKDLRYAAFRAFGFGLWCEVSVRQMHSTDLFTVGRGF